MTQPKLGKFPYQFADPQLAFTALSASSLQAERFEWLGDKVLGCCVAELLLRHHPERNEAELSRATGRLVTNANLHAIGLQLGLEELPVQRPGKWFLANSIEALLGAVFTEGGFTAAQRCIAHLFEEQVVNLSGVLWKRDPKTLLKEACEIRGEALPRFELVAAKLDSHEVTCYALGVQGTGTGRTKLNAEMDAAVLVIRKTADPQLLAELQ